MATKTTRKKQKPLIHHLKNRRLALPIIALVIAVGAIIVFRSFAATAPYTRLQCYGADHQGYKDTEQCYQHSKEGMTARAFIAVLNRTPETSALQYWSNVYNMYPSGSQQQVILRILNSSEAKRKFNSLPNDAARVTYLYNSVLKRKPDSGGAKYWQARMKLDNNMAKTITSFIASNEAYTKTRPAVLAALNKLSGNWWPTRVGKTVSPRGAYSNWQWNATTNGYNSFEHNLIVDSYQPGSSYFWSHQFGFIGGDAGYIGLQSTGIKNSDGSYRKLAVFSIFGAAVAAEPSYCRVERTTFDGSPGSGSSCITSFNWSQGRSYRLKTAKTSQDSTGSWWSGFVVDTVTGAQTKIGQIKVPLSWKGLNNASVMWTENYVSTATTCDAIPYSKVRFSKPLANGNIAPISSSQNLASSYQCNTSRITPSGNTVTQEMGL